MTFKTFCYEMWLEYMEECLAYNIYAEHYQSYIKNNKWYLRKMYRLRYNKLQSKWKANYEHIFPRS